MISNNVLVKQLKQLRRKLVRFGAAGPGSSYFDGSSLLNSQVYLSNAHPMLYKQHQQDHCKSSPETW